MNNIIFCNMTANETIGLVLLALVEKIICALICSDTEESSILINGFRITKCRSLQARRDNIWSTLPIDANVSSSAFWSLSTYQN